MHYLDNALLGVHGLDKLCLGDVLYGLYIVRATSRGTAWLHAVNIYMYLYVHMLH